MGIFWAVDCHEATILLESSIEYDSTTRSKSLIRPRGSVGHIVEDRGLGTCCRDFSASPEKNYSWMLDRQADLLAMDPHSTSIVPKNLGSFLAPSIHWIWKIIR
jgi:hypothetical protein